MKGPLLIVFLFFVLYLLNNETNLMKGGAEETDSVSYPNYIILNSEKNVKIWNMLRLKANVEHQELLLDYLYENYVNENSNKNDIDFFKKKIRFIRI